MHRAEQILITIEKLLKLPLTRDNVERERQYAFEKLPAISIEQGDETPLDNSKTINFIDCALEVRVNIHLKGGRIKLDLNQIKSDVYSRLMNNRTLNLDYVIDTVWVGDEQPRFANDAEQKTALVSMVFNVNYRHPYLSKEV